MEVSRASAVRGSRLSGWHVRAILLALLIALLTPAIATAQTEAPVAPEEAPPTLDVGPSGDEGTAPAAESPAPADESQPPAAEQPTAAEPPAAEQPSSPAPPPAAEEPPLVELPDLVPPPAPVEPTPAPVAEGPAAAPAPTEATPTPSGTVTPGPAGRARRAPRHQVGRPARPGDRRELGEAADGPAATLKAMGGPTPPPTSVGLSSLGGPTAPPVVVADASATGPPGRPVGALLAPPGRPEFSTALLEPLGADGRCRRVATPPGRPAPQAATSDDNPFATIAAVGGPVPAGSSLLAVLASYVIPGGGALPTTTLFLFVQLAVILAAFFAPRLGRGELALALGRLGPRSGYRTVLARPG